jgi:hypothetical protein
MCSEKYLAHDTLSTNNPTLTTMGLNLDLHSDKPVTNKVTQCKTLVNGTSTKKYVSI